MKKMPLKTARRKKRKFRIRKRIAGTAGRPRVTVYKSNRFTYVQAIDDTVGHTIAAASNREKELRKIGNKAVHLDKLGEIMAERLKKQKITRVVFDRNGYIYHGKVKSLAEGIRKAGIQF